MEWPADVAATMVDATCTEPSAASGRMQSPSSYVRSSRNSEGRRPRAPRLSRHLHEGGHAWAHDAELRELASSPELGEVLR